MKSIDLVEKFYDKLDEMVEKYIDTYTNHILHLTVDRVFDRIIKETKLK